MAGEIVLGGTLVGAGFPGVKDLIAAFSGGGGGGVNNKRGPVPDQAPINLDEHLALEEAKTAKGRILIRNLADEPRLVDNYGPGNWVKKHYIHRAKDGSHIVVHWHENLTTGLRVEYKFPNR